MIRLHYYCCCRAPTTQICQWGKTNMYEYVVQYVRDLTVLLLEARGLNQVHEAAQVTPPFEFQTSVSFTIIHV